MTEDERKTLIKYRLERAENALRVADFLQQARLGNNDIMNRLYYAMFYGVLALLTDQQFSTSKHSGALSLFDREFVNKGIFPQEMSRAIRQAFKLRQKGDYCELIIIDDVDIEKYQPLAHEFVANVKNYLADKI